MVAFLQAADHFHVFEVAVAQLYLAFEQLIAVDDKEFVFPFPYIIGRVGNAEYIVFHSVHHVDICLQTGAQALVVVLIQLYGEGDHSVFREWRDVAHRTVQLVTADLDDRFTACGNAIAIGVGNLTLDLEMGLVGNDCHLRPLPDLRTDLVIYIC